MLFIVDYQNNAICKGGSEHGNMDINARRLSDNADGGGGLFMCLCAMALKEEKPVAINKGGNLKLGYL